MINYGSEGRYQTSFRSALGTCFQICAAIVTFLFTLTQFNVWLNYKETSFTSTVIQDHFDYEGYAFTEDDGFQIAFAVDHLSQVPNQLEDLLLEIEVVLYN